MRCGCCCGCYVWLADLGSNRTCRLRDVSREGAVFLKIPLQQGKPFLGPKLEKDSVISQSASLLGSSLAFFRG